MQFIDLVAQQKRVRKQIESRLKKVLDSGQYVLGPQVAELEDRLAAFVGAPHALACGSGTDALLLALLAHGVGPGDAVFCPPFTFIATAEMVSLIGAIPVFVDINGQTFNLDAEKLKRAAVAVRTNDPRMHPLPEGPAGGLRPKAVIAVDLFGLPADYQAIEAAAQEEGLVVIEDAAQSLGGEYQGTACRGPGIHRLRVLLPGQAPGRLRRRGHGLQPGRRHGPPVALPARARPGRADL